MDYFTKPNKTEFFSAVDRFDSNNEAKQFKILYQEIIEEIARNAENILTSYFVKNNPLQKAKYLFNPNRAKNHVDAYLEYMQPNANNTWHANRINFRFSFRLSQNRITLSEKDQQSDCDYYVFCFRPEIGETSYVLIKKDDLPFGMSKYQYINPYRKARKKEYQYELDKDITKYVILKSQYWFYSVDNGKLEETKINGYMQPNATLSFDGKAAKFYDVLCLDSNMIQPLTIRQLSKFTGIEEKILHNKVNRDKKYLLEGKKIKPIKLLDGREVVFVLGCFHTTDIFITYIDNLTLLQKTNDMEKYQKDYQQNNREHLTEYMREYRAGK